MLSAQTKNEIDSLAANASRDDQYNAVLFQYALNAFSNGECGGAVYALNALKRLSPGIAEVHYSLGLIHHSLDNRAEAVISFQNALAIRSTYVDAWLNLGKVQMQDGKLKDAVDSFVRVVQIDPQRDQAFRFLGDIYRELGYFKEAIDAYGAELALVPDRLDCRLDIGLTYLSQGKFPEAAIEFQEILAVDPTISEVHFNLGLTFHKQQKLHLAESAYRQALKANPKNVGAHNNLGIVLDILGRSQEAVAHYEEILKIEPENQGVRHILAALTGKQVKNAVPEYVVPLFDQYSDGFDVELVKHLKYTVPAKLKEAVAGCRKEVNHFEHVLDLGCGTGMCGEAFWDRATRITGVDLSSKMLGQALRKGVYDDLHNLDIVEFLEKRQTLYDLFLAADVFIYVGDLDAVFRAVRQRSKPGALFAFSVERWEGDSFWLRSSGRYAHSRRYIRRLAARYGFTLKTDLSTGIRLENDKWIDGDIYILKSPEFVSDTLFAGEKTVRLPAGRGASAQVLAG
ncbi:MAG: tetratricopeptide repeat protein [Desulfobacter sp.]|nr:MAG: tetratricopeptide repeat protein [Desulfobacter sp.]